ncbi:MAG: NAD-dependent epimerase/dehydratase family protein [Thermodesulfobacteriota bacterium]
MDKKTVLITGGAGFVGSSLALLFKKKYPGLRIICLDNLKRRGSELNLRRLKRGMIEFIHGDIRNREDLAFEGIGIDAIIECSAEPSVLAGYTSSTDYLLNSNLVGTINCLQLAREKMSDFVFISTSRVYPVEKLNALKCEESPSRFTLLDRQPYPGATAEGIGDSFPLDGYRSLYGATKLASELLIHEYVHMFGLRSVINRCGVITGPWQMGKVDQGVVVLWMVRHYFKKDLSYIGFGGEGKQVRDLLHINDLFGLIDIELNDMEKFNNRVYNVGGGVDVSLSLLEATTICQDITGNRIRIDNVVENRKDDIKVYITDNTRVTEETGWRPEIGVEETMKDIFDWISENEQEIRDILL